MNFVSVYPSDVVYMVDHTWQLHYVFWLYKILQGFDYTSIYFDLCDIYAKYQ